MSKIQTFVIFDLETTGLPYQERNRTKITEASFLAVDINDLISTELSDIPPLSKLTFLLNPERQIHDDVIALNGLSNEYLRNSPKFKEKFSTLRRFLRDLPQPVCLVAHNGNCFDFKILLAECCDASVRLPDNILCADSLIGFRKILKNTNVCYETLKQKVQNNLEDYITDDEEWPALEVDQQDLEEIDSICDTLWSQTSLISESETDDSDNENARKRENIISNIFKKECSSVNTSSSYKVRDLFKRLLNKEQVNAHRAEADCLMLLECIVALKHEFITWAETACKLLNEVKPLNRY